MTKTPELDRAIEAAEDATEGMPYFGNVSNHDRTYARALVAELLRGIDPENEIHSVDVRIGWDAALDEIRRRAGLEGEG